MQVLRSEGGLLLRRAGASDVPVLARWRSDPRVLEFYGGRDRALNERGVRDRYFVRHRDPDTGRYYEFQPCLVKRDARPVAFVQYYRLPKFEQGLFDDAPGDLTYAIDFFIGEPALWGQGLGTRMIGLVRDYLLEHRGARRVVADPRVDNPRSVRALEKAGFRKVRVLPGREVHEGGRRDCWFMQFSAKGPSRGRRRRAGRDRPDAGARAGPGHEVGGESRWRT